MEVCLCRECGGVGGAWCPARRDTRGERGYDEREAGMAALILRGYDGKGGGYDGSHSARVWRKCKHALARRFLAVLVVGQYFRIAPKQFVYPQVRCCCYVIGLRE